MDNGLLFEAFEWNLPDNGDYYNDLILKKEGGYLWTY